MKRGEAGSAEPCFQSFGKLLFVEASGDAKNSLRLPQKAKAKSFKRL
jgi:hypothetical protein